MSQSLNKVRIKVVGAREHNLKNITVEIPKDTLTVVTGPSGSGKSTLALDILYTEGKRRYTESLSAYARQFLGVAKKPDVDSIEGLCPAIAIEQKTVGSNPRSTVGTITEIYDYLRVLFARIGLLHCPVCKKSVGVQSPEAIADTIQTQFKNMTLMVVAPLAIQEKGEFKQELQLLFKNGWHRFIIDKKIYTFESEKELLAVDIKKTHRHDIDIIVDVVTVDFEERSRLLESVEKGLQLSEGMLKVIVDDSSHIYSSKKMCISCSQSFPEIEPRLFSFNSPFGACKDCSGLGESPDWLSRYVGEDDFINSLVQREYSAECHTCKGARLNHLALAVTIGGLSIAQVSSKAIDEILVFCNDLDIQKDQLQIAQPLLLEITKRLTFLMNVGLSYMTLSRTARTLSGGEGQRIRLATQIGSALSGVLYVLDEPSIGLHQRDNDRLIETLKTLRDQGNTVVVVEHDHDTISAADYVIDMGPAAGVLGGQITALGTPKEIMKNKKSLTGLYLSGALSIEVPKKTRTHTEVLTLKNVSLHNLKNLTVSFPLRVMCGVSGVSGSGKSTLVMEELVYRLQRVLSYRKIDRGDDKLSGYESLYNLVVIDQSPIGRTSRSNPATYLGIFDEMRNLFSSLPESKLRGYQPGRFSFNRPDGRCFDCKGDGSITVSMHFLADVTMECGTCQGKRYNQETLQIRYKGKSIADVLDLTVYEALQFFVSHASIAKRLQLLCDVGLEYVKLGQCSTTLSGGEAQRIKLVDELAKRGSSTMYVLDEPTTGLHTNDIAKLLVVLNRLVDKGNSMIIIEHNLDVLKTLDYLIDLGPEGGANGGNIVAFGTPKHIATVENSYTGRYLKKIFQKK